MEEKGEDSRAHSPHLEDGISACLSRLGKN